MKKNLISLLCCCCLFFTTRAQYQITVKAYIEKYKQLAINEEIRTGVPASITLAQAIIESQSGLSTLSIESNNHFGIKCKSDWTGETYYYDDDRKQECFRKYPSAEQSFIDHSDFLKNRPNYASLFLIDPTDYKAWAHGLKKAGYATNPIYASKLLKVIEDYNLQQFTLLALEDIKNGTKEDEATASIDEPSTTNQDTIAGPPSVAAIVQEPQPQQVVTLYEKGKYPQGVFSINQTKVIYASAGTSLFALANIYQISYPRLLEFNSLDKTDILDQDQLIFLEKKPKKSNTRDWHIVVPAETIEYIAQIEGVQLESLYEYNKMQKGLQPAVGEKVYLRPTTLHYYPKLVNQNSK